MKSIQFASIKTYAASKKSHLSHFLDAYAKNQGLYGGSMNLKTKQIHARK